MAVPDYKKLKQSASKGIGNLKQDCQKVKTKYGKLRKRTDKIAVELDSINKELPQVAKRMSDAMFAWQSVADLIIPKQEELKSADKAKKKQLESEIAKLHAQATNYRNKYNADSLRSEELTEEMMTGYSYLE